MRRVFLSYRRDDAPTSAHLLCKCLVEPEGFGPGSVFLDVDAIPDGVPFPVVLADALSKCEYFLAVIGCRWVTPRLHDPNDFVRQEVETALARTIPVVPVLVDGATMPSAADLPDVLRPLLDRNARTLRPAEFKHDVKRMVAGLPAAKKWLEDRAAPAPPVRKAGDRREVVLPGGVPMAFAWCPPGTFRMGSPLTEAGRDPDERPHEVTLTRGFWIGVHPVTQEQYLSATGLNPSRFQGLTRPVENATCFDAAHFCTEVKRRAGVALRLPTEAEWEYAARGGTGTPFHWGTALNGAQANCDGGNPYGTATAGPHLGETTPVGHYAAKFPHPWGLTDVCGNVWEWCEDWYDAGFYSRSPAADPVCRDGFLTDRVLRGGSWRGGSAACRVAYRGKRPPGYRDANYGFRVVLPAG